MTGGIFAVLDDIAILMDNVAVIGKVAAKKTAGILGDDLAVKAEKATGFQAKRDCTCFGRSQKALLSTN